MLTPLQKMPNNDGNLGKTIVATGFEWFMVNCTLIIYQRQPKRRR